MKRALFLILPLLSFACSAEPVSENDPGQSNDALTPDLEPDPGPKPEPEPTLGCENVLCDAGNVCTYGCDGNPACVPVVCEGFAGWTCPDGFSCKLEQDCSGADIGGTCVPDCAGDCGKCVSDEDCGDGYVCTAGEECLSWCECPECDVCAGHCKEK